MFGLVLTGNHFPALGALTNLVTALYVCCIDLGIPTLSFHVPKTLFVVMLGVSLPEPCHIGSTDFCWLHLHFEAGELLQIFKGNLSITNAKHHDIF